MDENPTPPGTPDPLPLPPLEPMRTPPSSAGRKVLWVIAGLLVVACVGGLWAARKYGWVRPAEPETGPSAEQIEAMSAKPVDLPPEIGALTPKLWPMLQQVNGQLEAQGLEDWPEAEAPFRGRDLRDDTANKVWGNPRVLWIRAKGERWKALILAREAQPKDEKNPVVLVLVDDAFGSPKLEVLKDHGPLGERLLWDGGDETPESDRMGEGKLPSGWSLAPHAFPDVPARLSRAGRGDDLDQRLYHPELGLAPYITDLNGEDGKIEGQPDLVPDDHGQLLARAAFDKAAEKTRSARFVWFEADGQVYGAELKKFEAWKAKAPAPEPSSEPAPQPVKDAP